MQNAKKLKDQAMKAYKDFLDADYAGNKEVADAKHKEYVEVYQLLGVSSMPQDAQDEWEDEITTIAEDAYVPPFARGA